MAFGSKEYADTLKGYRDGRAWLNGVEVEIVGGENEIDPLTLLRAYEKDVSVDSSMALAEGFCLNRVVRFTRNKSPLLEIDYRGGDLSAHFKKAPYLLDTLLQVAYALMLKKLTPPSDDSGTEERESGN